MTYAVVGALLFATPHLFSILFPRVRDSLRGQWGEGAWKGVYTILSLAGIVLLVLAYRGWGDSTGSEPLYEAWSGAKHVSMLAVFLSFVLLGASHGKGFLKHHLQHPFSLAMALWAGSHLLANGERTLVWLFSSILVVALADVVFSFARGNKKPTFEPRLRSDIVAVVVGLVLYAVFLFGFHPHVLGVPVVG